jgi:uncharacterized protein (TIGR00369 family)
MSMGCALLDQIPHRSYDQDGNHVVELDITDGIRGPTGAVHGGVIASLVDRVAAYAAVRASQRHVVTSNVSLSYLAAATGGPLQAVAELLRVGRRQGVVQVHVYDTGREGRLVATGLLTMTFLPGEASVPPAA